jgi:Tfp pilus assembly protein PilF
MSLLLEALKKAEKAKEEAQRRAKGADAGAAAEQPSAFDSEATVVDDGKHVTKRHELPDISAPLQILSEDLHPATPAKAAPAELRLADEPPPPREAKPAPAREPARAAASARSAQVAQTAAAGAERATAQRVFEAKFKEPNPRLPFFITLGVLGAIAIGAVAYFWIQLRSTPSLAVNTNPQRAADEKPVDPALLKPAAIPGAAPSAPVAGAIPGLPGAATAAAPTQPSAAPAQALPAPGVPAPQAPTAGAAIASQAAAAPAATASPAKAPAEAAPARNRPAARASSEDRPVSVSRPGPQINPQVASGYTAYMAGNLEKARGDYEQALRDEPANRDALLGLAAVEMRARRYDLADGYYQRVLRIDPRDPHAQAGMVALRSQQLDPVLVESRVKSLLSVDHDANVLYFTLGNQYAQQGRWAEAQQAYFRAFSADPENPDFAFNVAVSLDQLHQPRLALEYYRRALALSQKRTAAFDAEAARTRAQQLSH